MRAIIVAAVSTAAQAGDDKGSLREQLRLCREACVARDWDVVTEISIPGHSRNYAWLHEITNDCAQYKSMVRLISAEPSAIDLIVVRDYDRLWRTDLLRAELTALCRQHGVQIYSINQPQELADPQHLRGGGDTRRWLETISGILSEQENITRTRRMLEGRHTRVLERGLTSYGPNNMPFGYQACEANGIRPDPLTAHWVREIFRWRTEDRMAYHAISQRLDDLGVPTARGGSWNHTGVRRVIQNPVYIGHARFGEAYTENARHEPLIDDDTWHLAQRLGRERRVRYAGQRRKPPDGNLLAGLITCGLCGYAMSYQYSAWGTPSLRCSHYLRTSGRACQSNTHRAADVEQWVLGQVHRVYSDPAAWEAAQEHRDNGHGAELQQVEAALAELNRRWEQWAHAYEIRAISADEMLMRRGRISGQREGLEGRHQELVALTEDRTRRERVYEQVAALADELPRLDTPGLQRVYSAIIETIRLRQGEGPALVWL